jgi:hypothetical protein
MINYPVRVVGIMLAALFIFLNACSSVNSVRSSNSDSIENQLTSEEIKASLVQQDETNAETARDYYNLAFNAFDQARVEAPGQRTALYSAMLENLSITDDLALQEGDLDLRNNALKLLSFAWEKEHNLAIKALDSENRIKPDLASLAIARAHIRNAIQVMPDSLKSYELLIQIDYLDDDFAEAVQTIEIIETSLVLDEIEAARISEKKAFLRSKISPNMSLKTGSSLDLPVPYKVINALLDEGNWFEAINALQAERNKKPGQKQLIRTLALVHYKIAESQFSEIIQRIEDSRTGRIRLNASEKAQLNEADSHFQQAETLFSELVLTANSFQSFERDIALFYQNGAWYFDVLRATNWLPNYSFDLRVSNYANKSITSFIRLLKEEEENLSTWNTIASLYRVIGKEAEAIEAEKKARN